MNLLNSKGNKHGLWIIYGSKLIIEDTKVIGEYKGNLTGEFINGVMYGLWVKTYEDKEEKGEKFFYF